MIRKVIKPDRSSNTSVSGTQDPILEALLGQGEEPEMKEASTENKVFLMSL
jgi:hypothetical protein